MGRPLGGQALVSFAVILPLVLVPVAAYAIEASYAATRQAALAGVAAQVAEDAAQAIDEAAFRAGGPLQVEPGAARQEALAALSQLEPAAVLRGFDVTGVTVALVLEEKLPVRFAGWAPGSSITVSAGATAVLAAGYSSPSSLSPLPFRSFSMTG